MIFFYFQMRGNKFAALLLREQILKNKGGNVFDVIRRRRDGPMFVRIISPRISAYALFAHLIGCFV
jgi:hypothetical protein